MHTHETWNSNFEERAMEYIVHGPWLHRHARGSDLCNQRMLSPGVLFTKQWNGPMIN